MLPTSFAGPQTTMSAASDGIGFSYRYYPLANGGANCLAVTSSESKVYVLGSLTGNVLKQFGTLADYTCGGRACPLKTT